MTRLPQIPATLASYARLIGAESAIVLAWKCGGRRLRVHRGIPNPEIADVSGRCAALKIAAHFDGTQITIPLCTETVICYLFSQNWPQHRIVAELRCSASFVHKCVRRWRISQHRPAST